MTERLVRLIRKEWVSFDGSSPSDPLELPADRFLNKIYWWAIRHAQEQEDLDRFDRHLWIPPKGVRAPAGSPWSAEAETAAFQNLAAAINGGPA